MKTVLCAFNWFFITSVLTIKLSKTVELQVGVHEYPYACFLHFKNTQPTSCGASLIMVQAVLTAAHCMNDLRHKNGDIHAFFGSNVPNTASVVRRVKRYEINPKYNEEKGKNNLAVAFLQRSVPLQKVIKTIPLNIKDPIPGTDLFSVGWGKQDLGNLGDFSNLRPLKLTVQRMLSLEECNQIIGYNAAAGMLCALPTIGEHARALSGIVNALIKEILARDDAGDGLVTAQPRTLVGVLSYVSKGYSVYTGVAAERDWILKACRRLNGKNYFTSKVLNN